MTTTDAPQNSIEAFKNAVNAGYHFLEIDTVLNYNFVKGKTVFDGTVMVSHYDDLFGATGYQGSTKTGLTDGIGFLVNTDNSIVTQQTMRNNWVQNVDTSKTDREFVTIKQFLTTMKSYSDDSILMFDPKNFRPFVVNGKCLYFCYFPFDSKFYQQREIRETIKKIIQEGKALNMLHRMMFKVHQATGDAQTLMAIPHAKEVTWVLIPSLSNQFAALTYLDDWHNSLHASAKNVAYVEGLIYTEKSWAAKVFTPNQVVYDDFSDYVKRLLGRRTAQWVVSPVSRYGTTFPVYFSADQYLGNDENYRLGELIWHFNLLKYSKKSLMTTDAPYFFTRARSILNSR